ncbi:hypothetical protein CYMTET_47876 [Cymbomonas tetramitiformis]|uniref:Uncharacterized protein n=1 Tax=Cymbomonas tetramitiformis TaxID=36881 RepID=A0AAE0BV92_9CHLO|nr:hypothetical protein CYMTET_47876 [Cymbomonas tetramitiformis]
MAGSTGGSNLAEPKPIPGAAAKGIDDRQFPLLTEQLSALRAETSASRDVKDDATTKKATMGEPVPNEARQHGRPDTTDCMPKLLDLYGDKTHTTLCKKANSSMKFEQMVLEPALAYFHDAIVYEEDTVDLLQDLPESEQTPFLDELWDRMLRGHTTKKGIYGMLCNRYTMMGRTAARTP